MIQKIKKLLIFIVFILLLLQTILINAYLFRNGGSVTFYGVLIVFYLAFKLILSFIYKPFTGDLKKLHKVAAVVPSYNESAEGLLVTLKSILNQTYPIDEIYIIDDGSKDKAAINQVRDFISKNPELCKNVIAHALPQNVGKRHAQSWAFERSDAEVFLTVDSDSYIYPDATEELLKVFNDETIYAVTGHLNAINRSTNILTRLTDIRYDNAFGVERAAQTITGSVLVCSGPLSAYRREVIVPNLHKYKNQKFLGNIVNIGDDRCLTNYALDLGKAVYQSTARCDTQVPDNMIQYIKQQNRWNKSFFRESIISVKKWSKKPFVAMWTLIDIFMWITLLIALIRLFAGQITDFNPFKLLVFLFTIVVVALCRNVNYLAKYPFTFLLSPLYGILHLIVLQPLKMYSLLTLKNSKWGTRTETSDFNYHDSQGDLTGDNL